MEIIFVISISNRTSAQCEGEDVSFQWTFPILWFPCWYVTSAQIEKFLFGTSSRRQKVLGPKDEIISGFAIPLDAHIAALSVIFFLGFRQWWSRSGSPIRKPKNSHHDAGMLTLFESFFGILLLDSNFFFHHIVAQVCPSIWHFENSSPWLWSPRNSEKGNLPDPFKFVRTFLLLCHFHMNLNMQNSWPRWAVQPLINVILQSKPLIAFWNRPAHVAEPGPFLC